MTECWEGGFPGFAQHLAWGKGRRSSLTPNEAPSVAPVLSAGGDAWARVPQTRLPAPATALIKSLLAQLLETQGKPCSGTDSCFGGEIRGRDVWEQPGHGMVAGGRVVWGRAARQVLRCSGGSEATEGSGLGPEWYPPTHGSYFQGWV